MTKEFIFGFKRKDKVAVVSTLSPEHKPEAALVGIAISEDLEIIFDTVKTSRKYQNLLQNPSVALCLAGKTKQQCKDELLIVLDAGGSTIISQHPLQKPFRPALLKISR